MARESLYYDARSKKTLSLKIRGHPLILCSVVLLLISGSTWNVSRLSIYYCNYVEYSKQTAAAVDNVTVMYNDVFIKITIIHDN